MTVGVLLGLFAACFLASTVLPFSSEAAVVGALATGAPLLWVLAAATIGNTLGGVTSYGLGYFGYGWWSRRKPEKPMLPLAWQRRVDKYGHWLALLCWLPLVGDALAVALGAARASFWKVSFLMAIGKAARYALLILAWDASTIW